MIVIGGALLLLLLDVFVKERRILVNTTAALLTLAVAFIASVHLWVVNVGLAFPQGPEGMVTGDRFAQFFIFALLLACALAILISPPYVRTSQFDPGEFYALILFSTGGMMLMAAGTNLITSVPGPRAAVPVPLYSVRVRPEPAALPRGGFQVFSSQLLRVGFPGVWHGVAVWRYGLYQPGPYWTLSRQFGSVPRGAGEPVRVTRHRPDGSGVLVQAVDRAVSYVDSRRIRGSADARSPPLCRWPRRQPCSPRFCECSTSPWAGFRTSGSAYCGDSQLSPWSSETS